jgi:transcriptional regulator with XRE-family HTH domain
MTDNRIREFREAAGMSQVELARQARMASTNLSSIERGVLAPWPKVKRALVRVLKIPEAELFPNGKDGSHGN